MIFAYEKAVVCDGTGDATVYFGESIRGRVHAVKYTKGTLDAGTDIVMTGETTGVAILTDSPAANEWFYPQALANKAADGAAAADAFVPIYVLSERIKLVVAQGGAAGAGTVTVYVDEY